MTDLEEVPQQRAADQDTAVEQAFVKGTLPEEDRRATPTLVTVAGEDYVHVSAIHRIAAALGTDAKRVLHFLEAEFAAAEVALHIHPAYGSAIE